MTAESTVESTIASASQIASASADRASAYANQATSVFYAASQLNITDPTEPTQIIDPDNLPDLNSILDRDVTPEYTAAWTSKYNELIDRLKAEFLEYIDDYFPDLSTEITELSDRMLGVVRGDNSLMLDANTQQMLLDRHADSTNDQLVRTETEITNQFAARGWSAPQGQHEKQIIEAQTDVKLSICAQSREILIRQMELEIDNIKFATELLMDKKMEAIDGAVDYINVLGSSGSQASEYSANLLNAKNLYADLATKYYDVYVQLSQLLLQYDEIRINKDLKVYGIGVDADTTLIATKVGGAVAAANAMGDIAAAAYGSQNSIATIAHNTNATE